MDFKIYFSKGRQPCPAELGTRTAGSDYVQRCLNTILVILNSERLSEQYQYGSDLSPISGTMNMRLEIAKSGKVSKAKVLESSIASRDFRQMIVSAIERIDFGSSSEKESLEIRFSAPFKGLEAQ